MDDSGKILSRCTEFLAMATGQTRRTLMSVQSTTSSWDSTNQTTQTRVILTRRLQPMRGWSCRNHTLTRHWSVPAPLLPTLKSGSVSSLRYVRTLDAGLTILVQHEIILIDFDESISATHSYTGDAQADKTFLNNLYQR